MEMKFILGCVRRGLYLHDYGHHTPRLLGAAYRGRHHCPRIIQMPSGNKDGMNNDRQEEEARWPR
jgi:hypothetical protein